MTAISTQAREALRQAHDLIERDAALGDLVAELDPQRDQALFSLAGIVSRMLETHSTALNRIEAGGRLPRNTAEVALLTLRRTGCPSSQRQLYRLLGDLFD